MEQSSEKIFFLRNIDIYEGIDESELIKIAETAHECSFQPKNILYSPHEENQNVYVLKKGEVELYHSRDGKKIVFDVLTPGSVFGNFDITTPKQTHFAECTRPSYLCITPLQEFLKIISVYPELTLKLMQKMAQKMKDYEMKMETGSGNAEEKILFELQRLQEKRSKSFLGKYFKQPLYVTHEVLAELTGLNRVTVTRTIHKLEETSKIKIDPVTRSIEVK